MVVSIETKLLVLLPTTSNGMVAICARRVDQSEALTADVVKTIMAVSGPVDQSLSLLDPTFPEENLHNLPPSLRKESRTSSKDTTL